MPYNLIKGLNYQYYDKVPNYGDVFTKQVFIGHCKSGMFVDYDGDGHPAIIPRKSPFAYGGMNSRIVVKPSRVAQIPEEATHVVWFNK